MKKVDSKVLFPVLTKVEKVAQKLGSVKFEGWQATPNSELHIRAQVLDKKNFTGCFHCQELTITRKIEVVKPSYSSAGKRLVVYQCHCCDYHQETEEMIPRLSRSSSSSVSTNYDGYSGGSSSGSSSSGDSGGGGSFGGGDSGGGGAGGGF